MTTKSEWQAVNQALMADDRRRAGEPPAAEEVLAYMRSELSAEEAARVRERLVCHPDLVRTLTGSFPTEGAQPGDADYMSDREFASHWALLERRLKRGRVVEFWPVLGAIAATLAVVFAGLYWQARKELTTPHVMDAVFIMPDGPDYAERQQEALRKQRLRDAIIALTPGQRECIQLRLDDFTYEEIAKVLRISVDAVKSRLRDAKKILRERLGDGDALPEDES